MSQPSPADRLVRLLPPDGCRELVARLGEMRAAGVAGTAARVEISADGKVGLVLVDEKHYEWGREST